MTRTVLIICLFGRMFAFDIYNRVYVSMYDLMDLWFMGKRQLVITGVQVSLFKLMPIFARSSRKIKMGQYGSAARGLS